LTSKFATGYKFIWSCDNAIQYSAIVNVPYITNVYEALEITVMLAIIDINTYMMKIL